MPGRKPPGPPVKPSRPKAVPSPKKSALPPLTPELLAKLRVTLDDGPSAVPEGEESTWVRQGPTPIEFLTEVYRNDMQQMDHRIAAAKAVLDLVHRKMPARVEVEGVDLPFDPEALGDEEIAALQAILDRARAGPTQ